MLGEMEVSSQPSPAIPAVASLAVPANEEMDCIFVGESRPSDSVAVRNNQTPMALNSPDIQEIQPNTPRKRKRTKTEETTTVEAGKQEMRIIVSLSVASAH